MKCYISLSHAHTAHAYIQTHARTDGAGHSCVCPQGVLRIHLVEAHNLIAKDNFMGGMVKGKSDP